MKRKFSRILGVGLTIALLTSLMVMAIPVAAGDLVYTAVSTPSKIGEVLQANTDVDFLVVAADGTTMFAYDNTAKKLYKSTNAGVSWTTSSIGTGLNTIAIVAMAISPKYATDSTIVAATTTNVSISVDGGANFAWGPVPALVGGTISSVDLGSYYATNALNVLIGVTGSAANPSNVLRFPLYGAYVWSIVGALTDNVLAVRFSPLHLSDAEIVAVTADATGTKLNTQFGTMAWNANSPMTTITTETATSAVIAFGSDYIGAGSSQVTLVGLSGTATKDDVWRITQTYGVVGTVANLNVSGTTPPTPTRIKSIAVSGAIASQTLVASVGTPATVYSTPSPMGTVTWTTPGTSQPTGAAVTSVLWAGGAAYASTNGTDSALSKSADGLNWNQPSLIDVGTIANMSILDSAIVDANTMFLTMTNNITSSLFKTTNGGTSWARVLTTSTNMTIVKASPAYATDSTLYVADGTILLRKSTNGGVSFTTVGIPAPVTALAVVDKDTYYTGAAAALYKSGRWAAATGLTGTVKSIAISGTSILVGNDDGDVYISTDDAVKFTRVGIEDEMGNGATVIVVPDPKFNTNSTIYAGSSIATMGVMRATSTAKSDITASFTQLDDDTNSLIVNGLVASGTVLYAASGTASSGVIRRCIDPLTAVNALAVAPTPAAPTFQSMNATTPFAPGANAVLKNLAAVSTTLYAITSGMADATIPTDAYGYTDRLLTVKDTLTGKVSLSSPKYTKAGDVDPEVIPAEAGYDSSTPKWTAVTGATEYELWYDKKSDFSTVTKVTVTAPDVSKKISSLTSGVTYYWKVRVSKPVLGAWSDTWKFYTALPSVAAPTADWFPKLGAMDTSVTPTFTWPTVTGATGYEFVIGTDSTFLIIDLAANTKANAYAVTEPLLYSTTYYWRVRPTILELPTKVATVAEGGAWVASSFTTMSELAANAASAAAEAAAAAAAIGQYICPTDGLRFNTQAELETHIAAAHQPAAVKYVCPQDGLSFNSEAALQAHWTKVHAPQPVTPTIPTYLLWTIICIGAVLIIALIVLIVRTRRVA